MNFRVLVAVFSFIIMLIAGGLIPAAHFGDENEVWTKRLIVIAFVASVVFLVDLFWR
jgi:predicted membrane channel-forming protein YqfA (hemolysin III family)